MSDCKYWIGVASKDHVEAGVQKGICQFCHGKQWPVRRLKKDDFIIYYSPKTSINDNETYPKFTAIGKVIDVEPYQVEQLPGFMPFRRKVAYFDTKHAAIKPLIDSLQFIKNKQHWGGVFRFGFFEIDKNSFEVIKGQMLSM